MISAVLLAPFLTLAHITSVVRAFAFAAGAVAPQATPASVSQAVQTTFLRRNRSVASPSRLFFRDKQRNPSESLAPTTSKLEPETLKPGDILLWSTKVESAFERAVALLSGEEITHSAIVSRDIGTVIEQVPGGTTTEQYPWERQGRYVYVMRRRGIDLDPVLKIAEASLQSKDPMSYKNLLTLSTLLALKHPNLLMNKNEEIAEGFSEFFQSAAECYQKETTNSTYCAEFVFDCFEKAGPEYALKLDRALDRENDKTLDESLWRSIINNLLRLTTKENVRGKQNKMQQEQAMHHDETSNGSHADLATTEEKNQVLASAILDYWLNSAKQSDETPNADSSCAIEEMIPDILKTLEATPNLVTPGDLTRIRNADTTMIGPFVV